MYLHVNLNLWLKVQKKKIVALLKDTEMLPTENMAAKQFNEIFKLSSFVSLKDNRKLTFLACYSFLYIYKKKTVFIITQMPPRGDRPAQSNVCKSLNN